MRRLLCILSSMVIINLGFTTGYASASAKQPPIFSKQGGLYTEAFDLVLSISDSVNAAKDHQSVSEAVYYSLDGSDPVPGAVGTIKYTDSIPIKSRKGESDVLSLISTADKWKAPKGEVFKGWTVKAVTANLKGETSKVVTNSYFVDQDIYSRYNIPIISIVTDKSNFFDSTKGIYIVNNSKTQDDSPVPIHIEVFDKDGSLWFSQNAGAKLHGQSSSRYSQKTLRIYASEDYDDKDTFKYPIFSGLSDVEGKKIKSFKRLLLRNSGNDWKSTMFRDGLMHSLVSHLNLCTQAYKPSVLFLNGEFWGIHNIRERFDKYYFSSHYNIDKDKLAILSWKLSSNETIDIDEGTIEDKDDYLNGIMEFLKVNPIEEKNVYEKLKTKMDIDNFIDYQLSQIYFANSDWPGNNVIAWKYKTDDGDYHPEAPIGQDGRWRWVLKDTEFGFGLVRDASHDTLSYASTEIQGKDTQKGVKRGRNYEWAVFLLKTLLRNTEFRNEFINRFADNINTSFDTSRVNQKIDEMKADLEKAMPEHIDRWQSISDWDKNVEQMKTFAKDRPSNMRKFIVGKFTADGVTGTYKISLNSNINSGYIRINSIDIKSPTPGVISPESWTGTYFKGVPITIKAIAKKGFRFDHWEGLGDTYSNSITDTIAFDSSSDMNITAVFTLNVKDIKEHWAKSYIEEVMNNGIIEGYADYEFNPEGNIDRASAVVALAKVFGFKSGKYSKKILDKIPDRAKDSIMAAYEAGILNGYKDNTFGAEKSITRQELAVMIVKALGYKDLNAKRTSFKDNEKIAKWSLPYVEKAVELQLIKGYEDKSFRPDNMVTRAEFAAIISKLKYLIGS